MVWPLKRKPRVPTYSRNFAALTDSKTEALLTVSSNSAALVFLQECTPDTNRFPAVNYPDYPDPFFLENVDPGTYPEWTWGRRAGFKRTPPSVVTDELRAKARLLTQKVDVLGGMMTALSRARDSVWTGFNFQETIYLSKYEEARRFKESGYDESLILEMPYVVQYAEVANIPLQQAADDILFKAKLDSEFLSRTEALRIRYLRLLRETDDSAALVELMRKFRVDCFSPQLT